VSENARGCGFVGISPTHGRRHISVVTKFLS
jgi:hypothetical protein